MIRRKISCVHHACFPQSQLLPKSFACKIAVAYSIANIICESASLIESRNEQAGGFCRNGDMFAMPTTKAQHMFGPTPANLLKKSHTACPPVH